MKMNKIVVDNNFAFLWIKSTLRSLSCIRTSGLQPELICTNQFHVHLKQNRPTEDMEVLEHNLMPFSSLEEQIVIVLIENKSGCVSIGGLMPKNHRIIYGIEHDVVSIFQEGKT